jgi:hypothetical protein
MRLHSAISHKAIIFILDAMKTWNLTCSLLVSWCFQTENFIRIPLCTTQVKIISNTHEQLLKDILRTLNLLLNWLETFTSHNHYRIMSMWLINCKIKLKHGAIAQAALQCRLVRNHVLDYPSHAIAFRQGQQELWINLCILLIHFCE